MKIRFAGIESLASARMKRARVAALLFFLAFSVAGTDYAQEKPAAGAITDIRTAPENSKLMVTVATDRLLEPQEFLLEDPARLVLDFPGTQNRISFSQLPVRNAAVKKIRVQQFQSVPTPIARVVFDLAEGYGTHEINTNKEGVRLVFYNEKPASSASNAPRETISAPAPVKIVEASSSALKNVAKPAEPALKNQVIPPPPAAPAPAVPQASNPSPAPSKPPQVSSPRPAQMPKPAQTAQKRQVASPSAASSVHPLTPQQKVVASAETKKTVQAAADVKPRVQAETVPKASATPRSAAPAVKARTTLARAELPASAPAPDRKPASEQKKTVGSSELKQVELKTESPKTADPKPAAVQAAPQAPLVAALAANSAPAPRMITAPNSKFSGQPLTLDLIDFPLVDFFRLMSEEGGINIVMDPEIKGRVSIKVVKVPWDQIFEAVLTNNSLDKQVDGSVVRIARKTTLQEEAKQQESLKRANLLAADLETRIKRLNYSKANALAKALEDQKTVRGTIVVEDRSNSLIITDIPSSVTKLVQLIDALDTPQPQVEIEARIVSATRDFARDIGIQFGFVDGNLQRVTVGGPNTFGTIGGTRPSATPNSTFAAGNFNSGRGASDDQVTESAAVSTGTSSNNKGNYNVNLPATKAFGGLGISIGNIFDTFLLDAAITAGESKGNAKLISQPKVVAQNNSPAVVTQGLRFPVQVIANNTISVQFQNAALTLTVTPQITFEGNIVLDLKVENNTPDFSRHVNGTPSIRTSEATTRVLVSDGGTTVIGGILIDDEATQEDKVPGLGSLPIVGNLFRRNSVSRSTQEVLFFVTPRVIK